MGQNHDRINHSNPSSSPYLSEPKRVKASVRSLEVLMPMYSEFKEFSSPFATTINTEVIVEFNDYVRMLDKNLFELPIQKRRIREFDAKGWREAINYPTVYPFIFSEFALTEVIVVLCQLFDSIDKDIEHTKATLGKTPSGSEVSSNLSQQTIKLFQKVFTKFNDEFNHLYYTFLLNVTLMNIKSVVLCGKEIRSTNKSNIRVPIMPLKFKPRLGTHFSVLNPRMETDYVDFYKAVLGAKGKSLVGLTVDDAILEQLLNLTITKNHVDIFTISDVFGYTIEEYNQAYNNIIEVAVFLDTASSTYAEGDGFKLDPKEVITSSIQASTDFVSDLENYVDSLTMITNEARLLGQYACIKFIDVI